VIGSGAMSDDDPSPPKPPLAKPTAAWLAERRARNAAYAEQRRRYMEAWNRRIAELADEPESGGAGARPGDAARQETEVAGTRRDPRQAAGPLRPLTGGNHR